MFQISDFRQPRGVTLFIIILLLVGSLHQPSRFYSFPIVEIKKEKLLSLKVKQPASRKENTVQKIVFGKGTSLLLRK